ncbi:MAG: cell division protein FtsL [Spirochaetales bacterium]|nr:cell division protein FtsL [Spirochaetales bacterium]
MKKLVILVLILSIPAMLFLVTWQNIRFTELSASISSIREEQEDLMEKNKRLIIGLAILRSPKRIEDIGLKDLKLHEALPSEVIKIVKRK